MNSTASVVTYRGVAIDLLRRLSGELVFQFRYDLDVCTCRSLEQAKFYIDALKEEE